MQSNEDRSRLTSSGSISRYNHEEKISEIASTLNISEAEAGFLADVQVVSQLAQIINQMPNDRATVRNLNIPMRELEA